MNLVIVTADEMRADCAGWMGHPLRPTPCLDAFAGEAAVFRRHFTVHGKCVPSRVAMLTGRHPHTDGSRAINPECEIPVGAPNLLDFLGAQGFETAFFGHNHTHQNLLTGDNRPGMSAADFHSYSDGLLVAMLEKRHEVPPCAARELPATGPCTRVRCLPGPLTGFCDDNRAEQAVAYLRELRDPDRPFYLHVNFSNPHPPYEVEEPWFSRFPREQVQPFPSVEPKNAPLPIRAQRECRGAGELTDAAARELLAVYLGMIAKVDSLTGKILDALRIEGLLDNTLVIFTSDHGDFAGQYGLPEKWDTAMQDCILHVPMLVRAPGMPRSVLCDGLSDHTDIVPTVLELMGFDVPPQWGLHGRSLVPELSGTGTGKRVVFAGGGHEAAMHRRFNAKVWTEKNGEKVPNTQGKQLTYERYPAAMARTKMARTRDWKLVVRLEGGNELYYLPNDPFELNNLYGEPGTEGITAELLHEIVRWCLETDTDRPYLEKVGA